jgi:hypothetical protein
MPVSVGDEDEKARALWPAPSWLLPGEGQAARTKPTWGSRRPGVLRDDTTAAPRPIGWALLVLFRHTRGLRFVGISMHNCLTFRQGVLPRNLLQCEAVACFRGERLSD